MNKLNAVRLVMTVAVTMALAADLSAGDKGADGAKKKTGRAGIMARFDTDNDGKVTLEEYRNASAKMAEERFKAMDKDQNGELSETELHPGPKHGAALKARVKKAPAPKLDDNLGDADDADETQDMDE